MSFTTYYNVQNSRGCILGQEQFVISVLICAIDSTVMFLLHGQTDAVLEAHICEYVYTNSTEAEARLERITGHTQEKPWQHKSFVYNFCFNKLLKHLGEF